MVVNVIEGFEEEYKCPKVEDVGVAFVEWAEQYWGIEEVWNAGMKKLSEEKPNSESALWNYVRYIFWNRINELAKNKNRDIPSGGMIRQM